MKLTFQRHLLLSTQPPALVNTALPAYMGDIHHSIVSVIIQF